MSKTRSKEESINVFMSDVFTLLLVAKESDTIEEFLYRTVYAPNPEYLITSVDLLRHGRIQKFFLCRDILFERFEALGDSIEGINKIYQAMQGCPEIDDVLVTKINIILHANNDTRRMGRLKQKEFEESLKKLPDDPKQLEDILFNVVRHIK